MPTDERMIQSTYGFPRSVINEFRRASLERRIAGEEPHTQQGIVNMLVVEWLAKSGYWPPRKEKGPGLQDEG